MISRITDIRYSRGATIYTALIPKNLSLQWMTIDPRISSFGFVIPVIAVWATGRLHLYGETHDISQW